MIKFSVHISILFSLCFSFLRAQNNLIPAMINAAGGSGDVGGVHYDWSVGEPITLFGGATCDSIFSGFQHCAVDTHRVRTTTITAAGVTTFCLNDNVQLNSPIGSSYYWSNGATTQNITVSQTGNYFVKVFNSCGDSIMSNVISVNVLEPSVPEICMVTVDSLSQYNEIYWDKTAYPEADTFIVYRETGFNIYKVIGRVPYDSLSMFVDTLRTTYFPSTGDPNFTSYRYKLAIVDSCNNLSLKGPYHKTIKTDDLLNGVFQWNHYEIEGQTTPIPDLINYVLKRDADLDGIYETTIGATTSLTANDGNYFSYNTTADWRVFTDWNLSCSATLRVANNGDENDIQTVIVKSKSNIKNTRTVGIKSDLSSNSGLKVYPNPANDVVSVDVLDLTGEATITIENILGQIVYTNKTNQKLNQFNISTISTGVYLVKIKSGNQYLSQKLIIGK